MSKKYAVCIFLKINNSKKCGQCPLLKKEKKEKHFSCLLFLTATFCIFNIEKTVVYWFFNLLKTVVFSTFNLLKTVVYYALTIEDKKKCDLRR